MVASTDSQAPFLSVRDLWVAYTATPVLLGIDFDLRRGEARAIIGPNGAGKSTFVKALAGLLRKQRGSVVFDGRNITSLGAERIVRLGLSLVPEGRGIIPELTVEENLVLGASWWHNRRAVRSSIEEVLPTFPVLGKKLKDAAGSLSGGEQQMLAIARALIGKPRVLVLDEPSLGLAPRVIGEVCNLLNTLVRDAGLSVLLVEQNLNAAMAVADHITILSGGKIVAAGRKDELPERGELVRRYLGVEVAS